MFIYIIILPLISFLMIAVFGSRLGRRGVVYFSCFCLGLAFLMAVYFYVFYILNGISLLMDTNVLWFSAYYSRFNWSFLMDPVSGVMFLLVTFISFLVHLYSYSYMYYDIGFNRFMSFLSLFTFFMLFLVPSSNFLQMFFGWEGVGLCSYLLINFWFTRVQANKSALKAMLVNKVGDISFLIAIGLIYWMFHSLDFSVVFVLVPSVCNVFVNFWFFDIKYLDLLAFFLFSAAVGKSAQLGLHIWLPDAMEGPTPVSALIHAATMVTAGIFLVIRCNIVFSYAFVIINYIIVLGSLTVFFGATVACFQNDIKKVIAFSTCSQLGYMMVACGLLKYDVSLYHLVNHGFFKALLFLAAGAVIHALDDEQDMRRMGGLVKLMPFTYLVFLIGSLSLIGFPFFSGFYSKDFVLEACFINNGVSFNYLNIFSYCLCLISTFFTSVYSFRLIFLTFLGTPNGFLCKYKKVTDVDNIMLFVLFILAIFSILSGFLFRDFFVSFGTQLWGNSIMFFDNNLVEVEFYFYLLKLFPVILGFLGLSFIAVFNYSNFLKISFYEWLFVNHFSEFVKVYRFFNQKWWFDFIYNTFFVNFFLFFGYYVTFVKLDKGLLELVGPFGLYYFFNRLYLILYSLQSGSLINYVFYIIIVFVLFFFLFFISLVFDYTILVIFTVFCLLYDDKDNKP